MSAGLTIEQVLARSLRMPRRRLAAQSAVGRTMERAEAAAKERLLGGGAAAVAAATTASAAVPSSAHEELATSNPAATTQQPSAASSTSAHDAEAELLASAAAAAPAGSAVSMPSASASRQQQRYSIPIPKEDPDPFPDRPMLRRLDQLENGSLSRNSSDLLTRLKACRAMGDWRDALAAFEARPRAMSVNSEHLRTLVDTLVDADKADAIAALAADSSKLPSAAQADGVLCYTASALSRRDKWKEALAVLDSMRGASHAPIEAYNEIIEGRSNSGEFQAAMQIVFNLKDHDDKFVEEMAAYERDKASLEADEAGGTSSSSSSSSTVPLRSSSSSSLGDDGANDPNAPKRQFPRPDVATWASLITVLEDCGKPEMAREVITVVPPAERAVITASYVALVSTWAETQKQKRTGR